MPMKAPDPDKIRSEERLTMDQFLNLYNEDLPKAFPKASVVFLKEFKKAYPALFSESNTWSLEQHRKKFMDWRPQHIQSLEE